MVMQDTFSMSANSELNNYSRMCPACPRGLRECARSHAGCLALATSFLNRADDLADRVAPTKPGNRGDLAELHHSLRNSLRKQIDGRQHVAVAIVELHDPDVQ